nr:exo-alpha-sialidase [Phytoactinopolyspora alkaliphila]
MNPALLQAPDGDLVVVFQTTADAKPGGELRQIRSSDGGQTWGSSRVIAESTEYGSQGAITSARGEATLPDGTLLLAYNDGINHVAYNSRESVVFVARSADGGDTWTGTDEPITLPIPMREAWIAGQILVLDDGTLLLPVWGVHELVPDWQTNPMRSRSGVLRSFDGGQTWTQYSTIAYDPHNPPEFPPYYATNYISGANETELQQLPDGRIVAVIRYATGVGPNQGQVYLSHSDDGGVTWTHPVATAAQAEALNLTLAPCTDHLAGDQAKLLMAHRHLDENGNRTGRTALSVSFDEGVTWGGQTFLEEPGGAAHLGAGTGEPAQLRLPGGRLLIVFHAEVGGDPRKLVANIVEDATSAAQCQAQADAANAAAAATPTFFVERADRDEWPWPQASRVTSHPATALVANVIEEEAERVGCAYDPALELSTLDGVVLDPADTLTEAGVWNGSTLRLGHSSPAGLRIGFSELDVAPATRPLYGWNDTCAHAPLALDYRGRALGLDLDLPVGQSVTAVELRASAAGSRLDANDYRLFTSDDNETFVGLQAEDKTHLHGWAHHDINPAQGNLSSIGYTNNFAFDYENRSPGVDLRQRQLISTIDLVNSNPSTRLQASDLSVWVSDTNDGDWTPISNAQISATTEGFHITGVDTVARYVKVVQPYGDTAFTFANALPELMVVNGGGVQQQPRFGYRNGDTDPATGDLGSLGYTNNFAFDYNKRSAGVDLRYPQFVSRIVLVDRDTSTRLTPADISVWVSDTNNGDWQQVTGAAVTQEPGYLVIDGIDEVTQFVKVVQPYTDTAYTFVNALPDLLRVVTDETPLYGYLNGDTDPANGDLSHLGYYKDLAFDYNKRSVGADLRIPQLISSVTVTGTAASTRLVPGDLSVYVSQNNDGDWDEVTDVQITQNGGSFVIEGIDAVAQYVKITQPYTDTSPTFTNRLPDMLRVSSESAERDWTFSTRVENGRVIHRFEDLTVTDRFLKIHQRHEDTLGTFVLENPEIDVSVEISSECESGPSTETTVRFGPGDADSGVENYAVDGGCTVMDLLIGDDEFRNHGEFVRRVTQQSGKLRGAGVLSIRERAAIIRAAAHRDAGPR